MKIDASSLLRYIFATRAREPFLRGHIHHGMSLMVASETRAWRGGPPMWRLESANRDAPESAARAGRKTIIAPCYLEA